MKQNPAHIPGGMVPGKLREQLSTYIDETADGAPPALLLHGSRYSGKSAALRWAGDEVRRRGGVTAATGLSGGVDLIPRLTFLVEDLFGEFASKAPAAKALAEAAPRLGHIRALPEQLRLTCPKMGMPGDVAQAAEDIAELLAAVGQLAAGARSRVLVRVDDLHRTDAPGFRALIRAVERLRRSRLPVGVLAVGLPPLPRMLRTFEGTLAANVRVEQVTGCAEDEIRELLARLGIDGAALDELTAWVGGFPGLRLPAITAEIQADTAEAGAAALIARAETSLRRSVYDRRVEDLNDKERRLLEQAARTSAERWSWTELSAAGVRASVSAQALVPRLIKKEIIAPDSAFDEFSCVVPGLVEAIVGHAEIDAKIGAHYV